MRIARILTVIAVAAYAVAALAYAFHGLDTNPQYDNQGLGYASEMIEDARDGRLWHFLMQERKYPLGHVLPFVVVDGAILLFQDGITKHESFIVGRSIAMLFSLGTFLLLWRVAKRLNAQREAVLLLMTSVLFLLFTSAIRPHGPVAFWTLATLLCSIRMRERPSGMRTFAAFACAGIAFATLQNGLLAFVFPLWALLEWPLHRRNIGRTFAWLAASGIIAGIVGYPYLLRPLFGRAALGGADLGHDVGLTFDLVGSPLHWIPQLLGGEIVLLIIAGMTLWKMYRAWAFPAPWFGAICVYCALFLLIFGFHTSTAGRFFMPVFPLLALVGSQTLRSARPVVRSGIAMLVVLVSIKLLWLSFQPNTYQQISSFFGTRDGKTGTASQPGYFFTIPIDKRVNENDSIADVGTIALPDYDVANRAKMSKWTSCYHAVASHTTDDIVLLWNDTPWALWTLFEASRLGPNMTAYCKPDQPITR